MRSTGIILATVILIVGAFALSAWAIMLLWGALASYFGFRTIPFGIAILISVALTIVSSLFRSDK